MQDGVIKKKKKGVQIMRFNPSNVANAMLKGVSFTATFAIFAAIALTAGVHIKNCVKDLFPKKHKGKVEIHVIEFPEGEEHKEEDKGNNPAPSSSETKPETPGDELKK